MNRLKRLLHLILVAICVLSASVFYGCGADSLGPYEPLLPAVTGEEKFSSRFQLEEEPNFFYDLYGKKITEGSEIHRYTDQKSFDQNGKLIVGWSGQLESLRFSGQLNRTILTEETFLGRHTEFVIGDELLLKPETLFPNRYIIFKTEFDGLRWDISFAQEHHLFTIIHSRISNPIRVRRTGRADNLDLGLQFGRRNGLNATSGVRNIENARLIGFRGQGLLGDFFRIGFTYLNMHKEHPERLTNPFLGTVANTPPDRISVVFRDDSPEDNYTQRLTGFEGYDPDTHNAHLQEGVGAAFRSMKITVVTQALETLTPAERAIGAEPDLLPEQTRHIYVSPDELVLLNHSGSSEIRASVDGNWKIAAGFNKMKYDLVFSDPGINIDPRTVKSVVFDMVVAGDYNIAVIGFSEANRAEENPELQEWIKTTDGRIQMPYSDIIAAPGNYGQAPDYIRNRDTLTDNPAQWRGEGRPRKIRYRYGAARAATLYGVDLEGTIRNVFIRTHYSVNGKYKQYPTLPKDKVGFSRTQTTIQGQGGEESTGVSIDLSSGLHVDANGIPTYSETEGERFEAFLGGDGTDETGTGKLDRETAWFIQLKSRFSKLHLEAVLYRIAPGYTTNYLNFGAHPNRGEPFTLEGPPENQELSAERVPWDATNYVLIEDDDDGDDLPDSNDLDGVIPHADDRDQNGILDFQEDFLIFQADPPVFTDVTDLNHNGVLDAIEDDLEPEYEYGIDRQGYHLKATYNPLENLAVEVGWLNETEVSSRRRNNAKYVHLTYKRSILDFGNFHFQNRFVRVRDDIPDYAIALPVGELEPLHINDELDFYNARVNTTTLDCRYTAVRNLTLEAKLLVLMQKQFEPDESEALFTDIPDTPLTDERVDFLVPIEQVRDYDNKRLYPFYPDHGINALDPMDPGLIYDTANWRKRRYPERNIRQQLAILKAQYEIAFVDIPIVSKRLDDLTLTPMVKYVWDRAFDRSAEEIPEVLNPDLFLPTDTEPVEYLRFNRRSREDILGVRLDYQFTPRVSLLGGFQYRKFSNRDKNFKNYLSTFPSDQDVPNLYRPDLRTRIFNIQAMNRGEWLGFYVVILTGYQRTTNLFQHRTSTTMFVRAMMGF